jgi:hypothetical protein
MSGAETIPGKGANIKERNPTKEKASKLKSIISE